MMAISIRPQSINIGKIGNVLRFLKIQNIGNTKRIDHYNHIAHNTSKKLNLNGYATSTPKIHHRCLFWNDIYIYIYIFWDFIYIDSEMPVVIQSSHKWDFPPNALSNQGYFTEL